MRHLNKGNRPPNRYLVCTNAKHGMGCKHVPWRYDEIQDSILKNLTNLDIEAILKDDSAQRAKEALEAEKAELSLAQKAIRNLVALAEMADDLTELQTRLIERRVEEKALQAKVRELEAQSATPELGRKHFEQLQKLRETLEQAEGEELIELRLRISHELKRFIERIEFYPDGDDAWSYSMHLIGIRPGRENRFAAVIFKTGDGRIMMGNGKGTLWPGPKTEDGVRNAAIFPRARCEPATDGEIEQTEQEALLLE